MSYTKNKRVLETFTYSSGMTLFRWKRSHARWCRFYCECCGDDLDCNCGAVTWKYPS